MTIERERGLITFECDSCDAVEHFENCDFDSAWTELRKKGWRVKKIGIDWVHDCGKHGAMS
jgi:hypothetical protein